MKREHTILGKEKERYLHKRWWMCQRGWDQELLEGFRFSGKEQFQQRAGGTRLSWRLYRLEMEGENYRFFIVNKLFDEFKMKWIRVKAVLEEEIKVKSEIF